MILGKSGKRKEKLLLSERKDLSDIHVLFTTFMIEHHAFDFCRGCSCEQEDWLPYTKVTDVWEGLLFVSIHSIARYQRRGVYLPILSLEYFYNLRTIAPISKRIVRVICGRRFGIEYWWDVYNNHYVTNVNTTL